jgi:hypothetical protein
MNYIMLNDIMGNCRYTECCGAVCSQKAETFLIRCSGQND